MEKSDEFFDSYVTGNESIICYRQFIADIFLLRQVSSQAGNDFDTGCLSGGVIYGSLAFCIGRAFNPLLGCGANSDAAIADPCYGQ